MIRKRNAQVAVEFLTSYGWLILTVLIVIGAVAYFGFLNPQTYNVDDCWLGGQIICEDFFLDENGTMFLQVRNKLNRPIIIEAMKTKRRGIDEPYTTHTDCDGIPFQVNDVGVIMCTVDYPLSPGDEPVLDILIDFSRADGGTTYTAEGRIQSNVLEAEQTEGFSCASVGGEVCSPPDDGEWNCYGHIVDLQFQSEGICCVGECVKNVCESPLVPGNFDSGYAPGDTTPGNNKCCEASLGTTPTKPGYGDEQFETTPGVIDRAMWQTACKQNKGGTFRCYDDCVIITPGVCPGPLCGP